MLDKDMIFRGELRNHLDVYQVEPCQ